MCCNESQGIAIPAVNVSKRGVADPRGALKHSLKNRLEITGRATDNLEYLRGRSLLLRASFNSWVSRVIFVSRSPAGEPRLREAFDALRRFSVTSLGRRVLTGLPPALERRLTASPSALDVTS